MAIRFTWICIVFLTAFSSRAQNYFDYQHILNRTDTDISGKAFTRALQRLDTVYTNYSFVYARHCMKALQIACVAKDSVRAQKWLEKAYLQGIPDWMVHNDSLAKRAEIYTNCRPVRANYEHLHTRYLASINPGLRHQIDSMMIIDQFYTDRLNLSGRLPGFIVHYPSWRRNNKKQAKILCEIIETYGFPGERLIGIPETDTSSLWMARFGPRPEEVNAFTMLVHYFSDNRNSLNELLLPEVQNGNLPAVQYASLNDFMAKWGKRKYNNCYYNAWHRNYDPDQAESINARRNAIGLVDFEESYRTHAIRQERFRDRSAQGTILVE